MRSSSFTELPSETRTKIESACLGEASSFDAGMSCDALMTFYGKGLLSYPIDEARSAQLFALSCDALADVYEKGRGAASDPAKASEARALEVEAKKHNAPAP